MIDYDGGDRRVLLSRPHLDNPLGVTLHQGRLYWIDTGRHHGALFQAPLANVSDYGLLLTDLGVQLKDVKVRSRKRQKKNSSSSSSSSNN